MVLEAIVYKRGSLRLLDQRLLPLETVFIDVPGCDEVFTAIKDMIVRGAPAIAIAAGLALAVELANKPSLPSGKDAAEFVRKRLDYVVTSRPTAVNLAELCTRLKAVADAKSAGSSADVVEAVIAAAEEEQADDVRKNRAIGLNGVKALLADKGDRKLTLLTHCNTGSLATAGYGTALGVIRALAEAGKLAAVYASETRPYNQGARLTAFELVHDSLMPASLITDSAAASLMAAGKIDAVIVGADRVAANGDTANKIGTYCHAVAASHHGAPFYVAAPRTTLDPATPSGASIVIEQRPAEEITHFKGQQVAAPGIGVWNPSFDVTPAHLIAGIVTEAGVLRRNPATGTFPVAAHCAGGGGGGAPDGCAKRAPLETADVVRYIAGRPDLARRLGGAETSGAWRVREVGDGNINFVFIVEGPAGALVLKQALPYVRVVGEAWPLDLDRIRVEALSLEEHRRCCPEHVPEVFSWDAEGAVLAMRYIEPPHRILRLGLVEGRAFPLLAEQMARFLSRVLFRTSALAAPSGAAFREAAARFANPRMCELTEQVVFTDPYYPSPVNHHTSPQLDADAEALYGDAALVAAAQRLKERFVERQQALLHGDLHTGSVMAHEGSLFVIDSEFAFYGPMGFDIGAFLANLLLNYFASFGLEKEAGEDRSAQRSWLLSCLCATWELFSSEFLSEWNQHLSALPCGLAAKAAGGGAGAEAPAGSDAAAKQAPGAADLAKLFGAGAAGGAAEAKAAYQTGYLREVFVDSLGFAGCKMVRRIVGIAHVEDFKAIKDPDTRAASERMALRFGRALVVGAGAFGSIRDVAKAAEDEAAASRR